MSCLSTIEDAYRFAVEALEDYEKVAKQWPDETLQACKNTHAVSRHLNEARYHLHHARRRTRPDYHVSEDEL